MYPTDCVRYCNHRVQSIQDIQPVIDITEGQWFILLCERLLTNMLYLSSMNCEHNMNIPPFPCSLSSYLQQHREQSVAVLLHFRWHQSSSSSRASGPPWPATTTVEKRASHRRSERRSSSRSSRGGHIYVKYPGIFSTHSICSL